MLPFAPDLANMLQTMDAARKSLWETIEKVNELDKEGADSKFKEFKQIMSLMNKETDRITRDSKLYDREYRQGDET